MSRLSRVINTPLIDALRKTLASQTAFTLDEAVAIQQIAAPTFDEARRAAYVHRRLEQIRGLDNLSIDAVHNVYARLPGSDPSRPAVLVSAHTDTVFSAETSLAIQRDDRQIHGPGIGDNSLGVAVLLAVAASLAAQPRLPADIWFVANTREEGLGDLGGIRAALQKIQQSGPRLGCALVLEGMALGRIYHSGIAVRRLKIRCTAPGGHSWLHFGRPSAIHGLMRLGAQIAALRPPESPRTTFNIGVIEGGTSVNSIAAEASLLLDMRSESREMLATLENSVLALTDANREPELRFQVEVVGDRPAGAIPRSHPLVMLAQEVIEHIGQRPLFETGSTDANMPLSMGLPAITIGITEGGNAHRLDEYIECGPVQTGLWQTLLLVVGAASGLAD